MKLWFKNLKNSIKLNKSEFILVFGVFLIIIGIFLYFIFPVILGIGINMNYKIKEGNIMFDNWRETPIAIDTKVYLFHIENAKEFANGAIARVREVGPYVYKQYRVREVIEWSDDKQKVKFWETLSFHFDADQSNGSLDDKITLVNIPLLIVFSIINNAIERFPLSAVIRPVINNVVNILMNTYRERFIETRTAREILNGRRIGLLDTIDILAKPLRLLGLPVPEYGISSYKLRDNTYGFLALRNNSQSGPFEVYTGMGSDEQFMKYATYLDKSRLSVYRHSTCNALNGTDGSMFGPFIDENKPLYVFNQNACRSLRADYFSKTDVNGVSTLRFNFVDNLFDGPISNPNNWCFCPKNVNRNKCDGILDLSQCLGGVPFALSYPHFLNSPKFLKNVLGLNPEREKHLGFFDVEPTLGITLRGSGRFQINLKLKPFSFVPGLNNFRPTLLPYLWIDEGAEVNGWLGALLKAGCWGINGANYGFILTIIIGFSTVLISSVLIFKKRNQDNKILLKPTKKEFNNNNNHYYNQNQVLSQLSVEDLDGFDETDFKQENRMTLHPNDQREEGQIQPQAQILPDILRELHKDLLNKVQRMQYDCNTRQESGRRSNYSATLNRKDSIDNESIYESIYSDKKLGLNSSTHSASIASEVFLPPVEDGETHTTIIIQRKLNAQ